jgi:hypothetical protein
MAFLLFKGDTVVVTDERHWPVGHEVSASPRGPESATTRQGDPPPAEPPPVNAESGTDESEDGYGYGV